MLPDNIEEIMTSAPVETDRIQEELKNFSKEHKIHPNLLDFSLLGVELYYATESGQFYPFDPTGFRGEEELEDFLRKDIAITQRFRIEIIPKDKENQSNIDISLNINPKRTMLQIGINPTSRVAIKEGVWMKIKTALYKKMALNGIIMGFNEEKLHADLQSLEEKMIEANAIISEERITVINFPNPIEPIKDKIFFHYLKKAEKEEKKTKGKAKLPFAEKEEVLVEYRKAKPGKNGRTIFGEVIRPSPPQKEHAPAFEPGPKIIVDENEGRIEYKSSINGYILSEGKILDVTDTLEVETMSQKGTGSIEGEEDKDTKVKVTEEAADKEAIDSSVTVETDFVEINGNMAGGSIIRAKEVVIKGQTHGNAKVYAKLIKINIHRGYAEGKQVAVNKLERGKVVGEEVMINDGFGGEVKGVRVMYKKMLTNNRVFASEAVEIQNVEGAGNVITITFPEHLTQKEGEAPEPTVPGLQQEIHNLRRAYEARVESIKNSFGDIELEILNYKRRKENIPEFLLKRFKKYMEYKNEAESMKKAIGNLAKEVRKTEQRDMHNLYEMAKVRVVNHGTWADQNIVRFQLPEPDRPIDYMPNPNDNVIYMINNDNGQFVVETKEL